MSLYTVHHIYISNALNMSTAQEELCGSRVKVAVLTEGSHS